MICHNWFDCSQKTFSFDFAGTNLVLFTRALTEGLCTSRRENGSHSKCHFKNKMWFPLKACNNAFCVPLSLHIFMHRKFLKNSFSSCLPMRSTTVKLPSFMAFSPYPFHARIHLYAQRLNSTLNFLAWPCEYIINTQNILEISATILHDKGTSFVYNLHFKS